MALSKCDSFVWLWLSCCSGEPAGVGLCAQLWASSRPISKPTSSFTHLKLHPLHHGHQAVTDDPSLSLLLFVQPPAAQLLSPAACAVPGLSHRCWADVLTRDCLTIEFVSQFLFGKYIVSHTSVASSWTSLQKIRPSPAFFSHFSVELTS